MKKKELILNLINQKKFDKAETLIENINDIVQKNNLKGLLYFNKGEIQKAKNFFEKALKVDSENDDVLFNYAYILKLMNKDLDSWRYLMRIKNKDWATYDLLGDIEINNRSKAAGIKNYYIASTLTKDMSMKEKYDLAKKTFFKNIKIAFLCLPGLDTFIKPIYEYISFLYPSKLVISNNSEELKNAVEWADVIWLEWANEVANFVTNNIDLKEKKVVCRLHGYEVFTNIPGQINWNAIDHLFFVAKHKREIFFKRFGEKINIKKTSILRNGIDLSKFQYLNKKTPGKKLAIIGNINYRKGFEILLWAFYELIKKDDEYKLFIRGDFQDIRYKIAIETMIEELNLKKYIKFVPRVENLSMWLKDIDYIISSSIEESFHYTIGEAMAMGIKPVIHAWKESREIWPEKNIFRNTEEFLDIILNQEYNSENYRLFVEDKYPIEKQLFEIEKLLDSFEKDLNNSENYMLNNNRILRFNYSKTSENKYIWYLMNEFGRFQYGGGERVLVSFSKEAKKYGYKLIFISNNYTKKSLDILKDLGFEGEILIINTPLTEYPRDFIKIRNFIEELSSIKDKYPPDLVIGHPVTASMWLEEANKVLKLNVKHYLITIVNFLIGDISQNIKFYKESINNILHIDALTKEYLELRLKVNNFNFNEYNYVGVPYFTIDKLKNIRLNNNFDSKIRIIMYPRFTYTKSFVLNAVEDMAKLINNGYEFYVNIVGVGGFSNTIKEIIKFHNVEKYIKIIPLEKIDFRFVAIHDLAVNTGVSASETSYLGIPTIFADTTPWFNFVSQYTGYINPRGILGKDFNLEDPYFDFYSYNTYYDIVKSILDLENPKRYLRTLGEDLRNYTKEALKFYNEESVFKRILKFSGIL
ncbi:glycosyltransferase [Marinitoga sp. 1155]|uniref:glycosyltransferase n=1 Tax=Marinitoga sp. 1155 TaxID=1428448 RepID=UPI0006598155|nr:glycosyltransferase [Marinitoga sp. 1155]KLO21682.1 glycosyl transferase family 1 [Marinitoga sp. 1155]